MKEAKEWNGRCKSSYNQIKPGLEDSSVGRHSFLVHSSLVQVCNLARPSAPNIPNLFSG